MSTEPFDEQLVGLAALFDLAPWQVDVLRQFLLNPSARPHIAVPFRSGITDYYAALRALPEYMNEETP